MQTPLIEILKNSLDIDIPENIELDALKEKLSEYINHLIRTDFQKLIVILYKVDVSEPKLKELLILHSGEDAAGIITELIIERQEQKIKSRRQFKRNENISDDEKW
ncbi:MAG: hypothetical protein M3O67_10120 [Bacteroidota bacterium]|nr:hypothetical protein [Bacteroidota bacterium]